MRICLIALHFSEYGYRLASALAGRNDVLFISSKQNFQNEMGPLAACAEQSRLKCVLINDYRLRDPRIFISAFCLLKEVLKFRPDIIHCQEAYRDYLMAVLPFLRSYPVVLTVHDHVPHSGLDEESIINHRFRRYREMLRLRAQAVIVHGERIRMEIEKALPWLTGRVFALPHGVLGDPEKRPHKGWQPGQLLFFGRIEKYKGLGFFLDALDVLKKEGLNVHGIIAGTGSDLPPYLERIAKSPYITLLNRYILAEEIPALFHDANVVVLPYTDGTQSGVASYALRYGRPVVSTSVGSLPEVVRHGDNGIIVPACDVRALADAIRTLILNPEIASRMGSRAAQLADSEFSWKSISLRTEDVYYFAMNAYKSRK
jgi:glycosyltransferase involved in cell wall biosynthesis